jgi:hypothetical protein
MSRIILDQSRYRNLEVMWLEAIDPFSSFYTPQRVLERVTGFQEYGTE